MLFQKDWDGIAKILYKNQELLKSDPVIQQAINLFEEEYFSDIEVLGASKKKEVLEYPGLVVELKQTSFSPSFVSRFVDEKLRNLKELKSDALISYAASHQGRPLAREILAEIQSSKPESIADAKRSNVTIKSTKTGAGRPKTISLFKSKQEESFFEAVRGAFPTHHPYPNVSISSVLDYQAIKEALNSEQKNYFFKGVVDSVVFDARKSYQPMYFIELDSHFHDNSEARKNDGLKNSIFEVANVKLIRIRAYDLKECTVEKYKELIWEIMRDL